MRILLLLSLLCALSSLHSQNTGGKFLPAKGNVHALFIFAQFPDDKLSPEASFWKLNKAPGYINEFVDENASDISHNGSLSCYFDDMSLHQFQLTGKCLFIITPHSREWYMTNKKGRSFINSEIIREVDKEIDFSEFDKWTRKGNFNFEANPDDIVDMVFIVFRNIAADLPDTLKTKMENQFGLVPGGEASLGYGPDMKVDNNSRTVLMGYPGSGVNVKANLSLVPVSGCAHEFGHYLLGGNELHFSSSIYGLMSTWGFTQRSIMMNGWERMQLDWVNPGEKGPDKGIYKDIKIRDYLTTGDLIKINVPGSKEYFLLENHQQMNKFWDTPDQSGGNVKGIYVLQQSGNSGSTISLISADGKWNWEVKQKVRNPYGGKDSLPVFTKIKENPVDGSFDNEMITYRFKNKTSRDFIHFHIDPGSGKVIEKAVFRGDGNDSFILERNEFSENTNPRPLLKNKKSAGISFKIKSSEKEKDNSESYILDITVK